ncbi:MAG: NAD(P)H-hydrate dehydratase [Erysipelotrichaceae bacterium]|nr:NAD(P)H-hydrate dehydratase [Erysipelotrichaceae bacterium]
MNDILNNIPVALNNSNKSDNGILAVIAGSDFIAGSAVFNLLGASAVGTGYIYGIITEDIFDVCSSYAPWVVYRKEYIPSKEKAVLIGSGCDNREDFDEILINVLNASIHVIIDAYALRRYKDLGLKCKNKTVMTPHLGEFSYMTGLSVVEIKNDKEKISKEYALENNCILVLKDYETLITDGNNVYINKTGNATLAKAGSGDILAGFIAGLISRGVEPYDACITGCHLLGLSAQRVSEYMAISSITPLDIIEESKEILFEYKK